MQRSGYDSAVEEAIACKVGVYLFTITSIIEFHNGGIFAIGCHSLRDRAYWSTYQKLGMPFTSYSFPLMAANQYLIPQYIRRRFIGSSDCNPTLKLEGVLGVLMTCWMYWESASYPYKGTTKDCQLATTGCEIWP